MPSGADLEYARLLAAAGQLNGTGFDGALLEQMSDSRSPVSDIRGTRGKRYRFIAAALRNYGAPNYWQVVVEPGHTPVGISSVTSDGSVITVNYDFSSTQIGSLIATTDETMAKLGFSMGCSVGLSSATLVLSKDAPDLHDLVFYDGANFVSQNGIYTIGSYTAGVLTLTHPDIGATSGNAQVSSRGGSHRAVMAAASPPIDKTSIKIEFYDNAGTLVTVPHTGMRALVSRFDRGGAVNPQTAIDSTTQPNHNVWLFGIHEISE